MTYFITAVRILLLIGTCLLPIRQSWAIEAVPLPEGLQRKNMFGSMEFVIDPDKSLTLEQVRQLPASRFTTLTHANFNGGFSSAALWVRTRLHNTASEPVEWVLKHHFPIIDYAEFFVLVDGQLVRRAIGGDRTLLGERQIPYRYAAVRHTSQPGEQTEIYVRLSNDNDAYTLMVFELRGSSEFVSRMNSDQMQLGVLYGMPLALAFMAIIGWLITRDRRFSLYALYALSVLGSWMAMNGVLGQYVFVDSPKLANDAQMAFFLAAILFSAMFSRDFLRTRELVPVADWYFRILMWASAAGLALRFAGVYAPVNQFAILLMMFDALTPIAGWLALRRGVSYARWYVVAQLLYSTMIVIGVWLAQVTVYDYGGFIFAEIAFFGQLLLLSVAQYDRMRVLQRDKDIAERRYQGELRAQVAERTRDLEQARRHAEDANRSKSEFLANISHEIRTPINAIVGFTTLTQRTDLTPKQADYLQKLRTATESLSNIINGLLDFSRLETGRMEIVRMPFRLAEVIDATATQAAARAHAKGLTWKLVVAPDAEIIAVGDPERLSQVLNVLCDNAVKFTAHGEVELCVSVHAHAVDRAVLLFAVRDTGIGLTGEQTRKIFQPFIQADMSSTRRFGGTGLGLAVSQRLMAMMNGRIWFESQEGQGSTFFVEVELGVNDAAALHPSQAETRPALSTSAGADSTEGMPSTRPALPASGLPQWMDRFEQSFARVNGGLAFLHASDDSSSPLLNAGADLVATPETVVFLHEAKELLDALKRCLEENNTQAEELVAQLRSLSGETAPAWLADIADAVNALEYETALSSLRSLDS
jgi:two-component system, OmpR family, sensor histidine kinase BaeS